MSEAVSDKKCMTGVVGFFDQPSALIEATRKVREANYPCFDAFTPYPVHGLEEAQGLKRSPLPYVTFVAGLTGGSLGFLLQYWTSSQDWPIIVGGKPFNSWPASIPVTFEFTILFAALCTVGAMFLLNGFPNTRARAIDPKLTCDRFALFIEAPAPKSEEDDEDEVPESVRLGKVFNEDEAKELLKKWGAVDVRSVYAGGWFE